MIIFSFVFYFCPDVLSSFLALSCSLSQNVVVGLILIIVLIVVLVYCCRVRHPKYQSAYNTDEDQGNRAQTAEHALQQKLIRHPDVKPELYI